MENNYQNGHLNKKVEEPILGDPGVHEMGIPSRNGDPQKSPDTPGSPEGNTEGPGTASSEPLLPS